jgi:hypothetical protein
MWGRRVGDVNGIGCWITLYNHHRSQPPAVVYFTHIENDQHDSFP